MIKSFSRNRFGEHQGSGIKGHGQGGGSGRDQRSRRGGGNKPGSGPGGNCVCLKCGYKEPHITGRRCFDQACPEYDTMMVHD